MRRRYYDYLVEFRGYFEGTGLTKSQLESVLIFEWMITGCLQMDPDVPVEEAWSILLGYDNPILKCTDNLEIVHRLRVLFRDIRTSGKWNYIIQDYTSIDSQYLLYAQNNGVWIKRVPQLFSHRERWYMDRLSSPIPVKIKEINFASKGSFTYERWISSNTTRSFEGVIPWQQVQSSTLPSYREKRRIERKLGMNTIHENLKEVSATADKLGQTQDKTLNIPSRLVRLAHDTDKAFRYEGIQHIVGGLGSGKTKFMLDETIRLVKEDGLRIGFIEGSVAQVLNRVEQLKRADLKAVPIIGKSNRSLYEQQLLSSRQHQIDDLTDWGSKIGEGLEHVSTTCYIHALAGDEDASNDYPCRRIKQNGESKCCPFSSQCGIYQDYAMLADAEVWVTTSPGVLKTRLPIFIDSLERSVYEAMYDLLDVIFVDEADEVQKQFDSAFINEYPLFGHGGQLFESLYKESMNKTLGEYELFSGDYDVDSWNHYMSLMERVTRAGIYDKLLKTPRLQQYIRRVMIRLTTLTYKISHACSVDDQHQDEVFQNLSSYLGSPLDHSIAASVEKLMDARSHSEKRLILDTVLTEINGAFRSNVDRDLWYDILEFYLYLVRADYCIREIKNIYPIIQAKLQLTSELYQQLTVNEDMRPFIKEAMTGALTGYSYDVRDGDTIGTFKIVEYTGVGRLLLQDWHQVYDYSDSKKGPALVLLSGTSLAPGSAHYHVDIEPQWLLERDIKTPVIEQQYWPAFHDDPDEALSISGIRDQDQRDRNLRIMMTKLLAKVEHEIREWKHHGSSRRILIIVNSYDDVETIGEVLQRESRWKGRYKLLNRQMDSGDEAMYSRSNIESFHLEGAELLVTPLMSINRGYNILDKQQGSLFGSVFFLIRPYPVPHDMGYLVQMIHAKHAGFVEEIRSENLSYAKALNALRWKSNKHFHYLYERPDYWKHLSETEREMVAWYTFVPVWQLIGRLIRNGSPARVFYCDAKFIKAPRQEDTDQSMLGYWKKIMLKHSDKKGFVSLYTAFIESIQQIRGVEIE
ncbi:hypothetical protein [Paenibacillus sp. Soil724D2]|uniref:pPIWI_RE_Z domain-containing protein n=1 Tax=Paenibacillus sp. (strain Soil724D2) TaxID=1736392 RepID=UPI000715F2C4|nr:hypothetical protein [Paenibacillus sp. Soil724D2]KRE50657.1 hypothetical protein ASG85_20615 [Paenibacillus sp. Soil724D2]